MQVVEYAIYTITALYAFLIIYYAVGWLKVKPFRRVKNDHGITVSLIIAARNEAVHMPGIIADIAAQDYPPELLEVCITDDHSTDDTRVVAENEKQRHGLLHMRVFGLVDETGKKAAIRHGITCTSGELIVTTDADCRFGPSWISELVSYYAGKKPDMIIGPVAVRGHGLLGKMQEMEFAGLQGVTGGAVGNGAPVMCNGANLAYTRKAFEQAGGFDGTDRYASGDDVFLLLKLRKQSRSRIGFLKSRNAMVQTEAKHNTSGLMAQRIRWASKIKGYNDWHILFSAVLVYFVNVSVLLSLFLSIFNPVFADLLMAQLAVKCIIDFLFLYLVLSFFGKRRLISLMLPGELLNIIHVTLAGFMGLTGSYTWKGRKHR